MKMISIPNVKSKLGRVIDRVIKAREPLVIQRGENHVMIMPYDLPAPREIELVEIFEEMNNGRKPIQEDAKLSKAIQITIRKIRSKNLKMKSGSSSQRIKKRP